MKVLILAGGYGTRLFPLTKSIAKPMVKIKGKPLITYIIRHYLKYGLNDFVISAGYKYESIVDYFYKKKVSLQKIKKGLVIKKKLFGFNCKITIVFTGLKTMTGGRILKVKNFLSDNFYCTYGDGLGNVKIDQIKNLHLKKNALITVTAVRPLSRFGILKIKNNKVIFFKEKSQMSDGWINGGFFVINKNFLKFIKNSSSILEKDPLEKAVKLKKFFAYKHRGLWHCIDTARDKLIFEKNIDKFI